MDYFIISTTISSSWLDTLKSISSILSDLGILAITLYTLWLKFFSKDIQVSQISTEQNIFKGKRSSVTLVNHTLHPVSIDRVEAVMNNNLRMTISEEKITLAPFNVFKFSTNWYEVSSDAPDIHTCNNLYFDIFLSHGKKVRILYRGTLQKQDEIEVLTLHSSHVNGIYYSKCCRYLISYIDFNNKEQNIFVLNNGFLENPFFNISKIPLESMKNKETLYTFLKEKVNLPTQITITSLNK